MSSTALLLASFLALGAATAQDPPDPSAASAPAGAGGQGSDEEDDPASQSLDPDELERAALSLEAELRAGFLDALVRADPEALERGLEAGFRGRWPAPGSGALHAGAELEVEVLAGQGLEELDASAFVARLRECRAAWSSIARSQLALERLEAPLEPARARGRLRLALQGPGTSGARAELQAELDFELARGEAGARFTRLDFAGGHHARAGRPVFAELSGLTGFHAGFSHAQGELTRLLVDERMLPMTAGLSVVDWNGDGLPDLLATRHAQTSLLFVNDGDGGFVRQPLPIRSPKESPQAVLFLDLDGDGLEEFVAGSVLGHEGTRAWIGIATRRAGAWALAERALEFELPRGLRELEISAIAPGDADGDGRIDLYVCVYQDARSSGADASPFAAFDGGDDLLFMNQGGLGFREESAARGISGRQYSTAALFHDLDGDGDQDLFVAADHGPDWLYENRGQGRFERRARHPLSATPAPTLGLALGDLEGDGRLVLYRSGPASPVAERLRALAGSRSEALGAALSDIGRGGSLHWLDADGVSADRAAELGLADAGFAFAPLFLDVDNDGRSELFVTSGNFSHRDPSRPDWASVHWRQAISEAIDAMRGRPRRPLPARLRSGFEGSFEGRQPDRLFLAPPGAGGKHFDVAYALGLELVEDGRAAVAIDFDGDGDQDLALHTLQGLHLFENRSPARSFARIQLQGQGGARAAIGAKVRVRTGSREQVGVLQASSALASQPAHELHFGLGEAERIERIHVRWPSGAEQEWQDLPVRRRILLREAEPEAQVAPLPRWPQAHRPSPTASARVEARAREVGGEARGMLGTTGRPTLVCFLSLEGTQGREQLERCARAAAGIGAALRFAAVALEEGRGSELAAHAAEKGTRAALFLADPALALSFGLDLEAPPAHAVFLFDAEGRLRRSWRRPVQPAEIETLVASFRENSPFALDLVRVARLHTSRGSFQEAIACLREALREDARFAPAHLEIGKLFAIIGDAEKAEESFARAVLLDPDLAQAQYNLGTARMVRGKPIEAAAAFEQALAIQGDDMETLFALGSARAASKDFEGALAAFERARRAHPESPTAWYLCGRALADLGRTADARASLARALELAPELTLAREALEALDGAPR